MITSLLKTHKNEVNNMDYNKINEILKNDGVIAFVTDTVWGLGCFPNIEKAVKRIYDEANKRK